MKSGRLQAEHPARGFAALVLHAGHQLAAKLGSLWFALPVPGGFLGQGKSRFSFFSPHISFSPSIPTQWTVPQQPNAVYKRKIIPLGIMCTGFEKSTGFVVLSVWQITFNSKSLLWFEKLGDRLKQRAAQWVALVSRRKIREQTHFCLGRERRAMHVGSGRLEMTRGQSRLRFYLWRAQGGLQVLETPTPHLGLSPRAVVKCSRASCSSQLERSWQPGLSLWFDPFIPSFSGAAPPIPALSTASAPAQQGSLRPPASAHTRNVSQGPDCVTTFLPSRGCGVPWAHGAEGLGSLFWEPLIRWDFPTVLWWDKRRLCSSLRPDTGVPSACPS